MQVILDTNVLLGALIARQGPPDAIYKAWRSGAFDLVTSTAQLDELRRVSRYPKLRTMLTANMVGAMINNMHRATVLDKLEKIPEFIELKDPNDEFLLAMAITANADYLVTGDRRAGLLELGNIGRTRILTPSAFLSIF